jgi:hypothetical protein
LTIRLQASVQSLVFVIMLAATLFGTSGRIDIIEFWVYIAIVAAISVLSLTILDTDLMQERMRPGGRRVVSPAPPATQAASAPRSDATG